MAACVGEKQINKVGENIQHHEDILLTTINLPLQERVFLVIEALLHQGTPKVLQLVRRNLELSDRLLRPVAVNLQVLSLFTLSQDQTPMIEESAERAVTDAQKRSRKKWLAFQRTSGYESPSSKQPPWHSRLRRENYAFKIFRQQVR